MFLKITIKINPIENSRPAKPKIKKLVEKIVISSFMAPTNNT
jgi:hypothetical protein